jgi:hypothetical protein
MKPDHEKSRPAFEAAVKLYNQGYQAGHHDTVEGIFTPIHHTDMNTYHADEVAEILREQDSAPAAPLICCKCGEPHGLGHCLDFAKGPAQPTLDEATAPQPETATGATCLRCGCKPWLCLCEPQPDPQQGGGAVEQRADEHFAGYNAAVEITPRPRIETHTSNFLGIEWVRERDYIDLAAQLAEAQRREERLREVLGWYAGELRFCNSMSPEGDASRNRLAKDRGNRAIDVLAALAETKESAQPTK